MLLAEGMNIRILLFPDNDDPDSFARKHPREFVENFIKTEAKDFINFKAEILLKEAENDPIKKAEAVRDIVKSVAFVENSLKQEIYLKEISTKFDLSEQSLFNELGVQQQIRQNQTKIQPKTEVSQRLEIVREALSVNPLLILEEKLVELMLKYGDQILDRQNAENQPYKISVIEEIIHHFGEDEYEIQSPLNQKIIAEIKQGIAENELRSGNFFLTLMDEEISGKVADALVEPYNTSNWQKHNIYFSTEDEVVPKIVSDVIIRHKREFILKMINQLKNALSENENKE
jgi:DNA primase